jgi:K+:H+ antiporter subunit KhtT
MAEVRETKLPGVGVRREFTAHDGTVVGVVEHHDGRSDVVVYDTDDPDVCSSMLHLDATDTRTMARLLGASEISEGMREAQAQIEGLVFEWIKVPSTSSFGGTSIQDGELRTRTGASVVAVLRADHSVPAPDSTFVIEPDDTVVAVGTADGLAALRDILVD